LEPHRSLSPKAFRRLIFALWLLSLIPMTIFFFEGAWPVPGFVGLDVVLLFLAFRTSYRHGRLYERVRLTRSELVIDRVWPGGKRQTWTLEPYWARVELTDKDEHHCKLAVVCRGQSITIGGFLAPDERRSFAAALGAALAQRKT
jgi:uncharacterized membrane protein